MTAYEMEKLKIQAEEIIKRAGNIFVDTVIEQNDIEEKSFANYVTVVDYRVQEFLIREFNNITPGCNIIAEESGKNFFEHKDIAWVIDPVDGTTNLMYDFRLSAISVGLLVEGVPTMGFVYNPFSGEFFFAEKGKGAFLNGEPIRASKCRELKDSLIGFGTTPYDRSKADITFDITKNIFLHCRDIRRTGSAALDLAYVACGRLDGFYELNLQPWDFAAGIVILEEAGGKITDWSGSKLSGLKPSSIAASNGGLHESLRSYLYKSAY